MSNSGRKVCGDMGCVLNSCQHLIGRQCVLGCHGFDCLTAADRSDQRRDIDASASDTRFAKAHIRVERDSWEDFHGVLFEILPHRDRPEAVSVSVISSVIGLVKPENRSEQTKADEGIRKG